MFLTFSLINKKFSKIWNFQETVQNQFFPNNFGLGQQNLKNKVPLEPYCENAWLQHVRYVNLSFYNQLIPKNSNVSVWHQNLKVDVTKAKNSNKLTQPYILHLGVECDHLITKTCLICWILEIIPPKRHSTFFRRLPPL